MMEECWNSVPGFSNLWKLDEQETRYKSLLPASCNRAPRWEIGAKCDGCNEPGCPSPFCSCAECRTDVARERLWILTNLIEAQKSLLSLKQSRRELKSLLNKSPLQPETDDDKKTRSNIAALIQQHNELRQQFCAAIPGDVNCLPCE